MVEKEIVEKEQATAVDKVFEKRRKVKKKFEFLKAKPLLFIAAVFCGFLIILGLLFGASSAKVRVINIEGDDYLSEKLVQELSGVSRKDVFYLLFPSQIEKRLEKSEFIASAKVSLKENNIVKIVIVEEQPIAYRYKENPEILLKNGRLIPLEEKYLMLIARIPYLEGFDTEEQLANLAKSFKNVDASAIELISEIKRYPLSYDENTIQMFMMNGNYLFSSYFSVQTLNAYTKISSELTESGICIFADDGKEVAYTSVCPWDVIVEEKEYWYDSLGNIMVDQYGDPIEKKYYKNPAGEFILDSEGNKVVVPVGADENDLSWMEPQTPEGEGPR